VFGIKLGTQHKKIKNNGDVFFGYLWNNIFCEPNKRNGRYSENTVYLYVLKIFDAGADVNPHENNAS
jgi:hypothetical protein